MVCRTSGHCVPARCAQGRAHLPGQHVVRQVLVAAHLCIEVQRVVAQALRGLLAQHAPDPVALLGGELRAPLAIELARGVVGVGRGQLDQRQHHHFLARFRRHDDTAGQVTGGAVVELLELRQRLRRHDLQGGRRRPRTVGLDREARLAPGIVGGHAPGAGRVADQPRGGERAAVVGIALREPVAAYFLGLRRGRGRAFANMGHQQRVTAHLAVVFHAVLGVFGLEIGPVAALAQQKEPVVAQAIFLVGAGVAREEVLHFLRAGGIEAGLELPVGGPRLQHVAARLGQQLGEFLAVALAEGLVHFQDEVIPPGLRVGRADDRYRDQCQNS